MAVSHSFTGEDIEDGGGKETDADRKQNNIKHGNNPEGDLQLNASKPVRAPPVPERGFPNTQDHIAHPRVYPFSEVPVAISGSDYLESMKCTPCN